MEESEPVDMFISLFNYSLLEVFGEIFSVLAFILIFIASVKMFRAVKIPGVNLIFYSIIVILLGTGSSLSYLLIAEGEESFIVEAIISFIVGIAFFVGAYGFWSLAKFIINTNTIK